MMHLEYQEPGVSNCMVFYFIREDLVGLAVRWCASMGVDFPVDAAKDSILRRFFKNTQHYTTGRKYKP